MREIKFRTWDKLDSRISGYFDFWDLDRENYPWVFDRDRTVVMQYTGLKDKNGKEIYEGDIVQSYDWGQPKRAKGIVIFEGYKWKTVPKNRGSHKTAYELWSDVVGEEGRAVEVIGNIYENPELLKS